MFYWKNKSPFEKGDKGGLKLYGFLWYIIFLFVLSSCLQKDKEPVRPNILFIMMDDLGYGKRDSEYCI